MTVRRINTVLGASGELQAIARAARLHARLQQVFLDSAPAELAKASRVRHYRAGTLFLWADNAAAATMLRQLAPRLLTAFRKQVAEINGIRVDVQVKNPREGAGHQVKKSPLPIEIIEEFSSLAERAVDPGLRLALTNFVRRSRRGSA
jgi:hypothetical protein